LKLPENDPDARLFTGPRGGRISTATLRDATSWDALHSLRKIAGHGTLTTTQRYLHPDRQSLTTAGELLSRHLSSPNGPQPRVVQ